MQRQLSENVAHLDMPVHKKYIAGKYRQYTTAFRKGPSLKLPPQTVSLLQSLSKGEFRLLSVCETPDLPHRPLTPEASLSI